MSLDTIYFARSITGADIITALDTQGYTTARANAIDSIGDPQQANTAVTLPSAATINITGNVSGSVGSVAGDVGGNVAGTVASVVGSVGSVAGNVVGSVEGSVASVAGNVVGSVEGNVAGSVASVISNVNATLDAADVTGNLPANVIQWNGNAAGNLPANFSETAIDANGAITVGVNGDKTGYALTVTPPTAEETANAVELILPADYLSATEQSQLANAADPLAVAVPGNYANGTAGYILGTNLNATVSSRSTLDAANAADAVWDEATSGHATANTFGNLVANAPGLVWSYATRTITALDANVVDDVVDGMWNALMSGYTVTGSFGARFGVLARVGEVTVTSPVSADGETLDIVIGYDYTTGDDNNPLTWSDASGIWPDLTLATVKLRIYNTSTSADLFTITGSVVDPGTTAQSVTYSMTATQSSQFAATKNVYVFYVEAEFGSSPVTTCLVRGWVNPTAAPTRNPYCNV